MKSIYDALVDIADTAERAVNSPLALEDLRCVTAQIAIMVRIQAAQAKRQAEYYARDRDDLIKAENRADEFADSLRRLKQITNKAQQHQAVVADCMTWFAGFEAAHVHRDGWERPWTPDREALRALNIALQAVAYPEPADADDEIPF